MYQIENQVYKATPNLSDSSKKYLTLFMVAFFPTLGEIIAINLGTWTYYVPYQILGVPFAAIVALIIMTRTTQNHRDPKNNNPHRNS